MKALTESQIAQRILRTRGYSEDDAKFAVNAIYSLNEGFDGEPVNPDWLAKEAMKRPLAELKALVDKYC